MLEPKTLKAPQEMYNNVDQGKAVIILANGNPKYYYR